MSLIKCPECGKKVSSNSKVCNGCGYPIKKPLIQKNTLKRILIVLIILAIFGFIASRVYYDFFDYEKIAYCDNGYDLEKDECVKEVFTDTIYVCSNQNYELEEGTSYCNLKSEYLIDPIVEYYCDSTYQEEMRDDNGNLKCRRTAGLFVGEIERPFERNTCPEGYSVALTKCVQNDKFETYKKYGLRMSAELSCPEGYRREGINIFGDTLQRCAKYEVMKPKYKKVKK